MRSLASSEAVGSSISIKCGFIDSYIGGADGMIQVFWLRRAGRTGGDLCF